MDSKIAWCEKYTEKVYRSSEEVEIRPLFNVIGKFFHQI